MSEVIFKMVSSVWDYGVDHDHQDHYDYYDDYSSNHSDMSSSTSSWFDSSSSSSPFLDFQRLLAGKSKGGEEEPLDYSVLSVGVMTLGLILVVEIGRHYIDHKVHGKPFSQAVLDNVYSECKYDLCLSLLSTVCFVDPFIVSSHPILTCSLVFSLHLHS